jgi:hypothetical protein
VRRGRVPAAVPGGRHGRQGREDGGEGLVMRRGVRRVVRRVVRERFRGIEGHRRSGGVLPASTIAFRRSNFASRNPPTTKKKIRLKIAYR